MSFSDLLLKKQCMRKFLLMVVELCMLSTINAQNPAKDLNRAQIESYYSNPISRLNRSDSIFLLQIQELSLPESYRNGAKSIPSIVDHSTSQFLQPIFYQVALECGQAAGIAYTFTYEMNRLRNLNSSIFANQYPTHFAWNFKNGGNGNGVNCLETWDVLRMAGTPNKVEWGGSNNYGGSKRWFSGYSNYFNAMKNRVYETYAISVNTPEGLQTLKYWLYDHIEGSLEGGIANFYSTYVGNGSAFITLPAGSPEAGKKVITQFSSYVNHCQTIVGYNDSIRYDYNGDGMYTNNVDINNDGVIDMRDWEIGGVKFTNSFGTDFGNNGFCYMMYKVLAESLNNGGIWNNQVYVIDVKENYEPLATYKVSLSHTGRGRVKIMAGIATNVAATSPEKIMEFSVFNYQGGDFYMQGDTTVSSKSIEFGLDISPLLNDVTPGSSTKFFLQVVENDPGNVFEGQIHNFSVMDYTSGVPIETPCMTSNQDISNNTITTLSTAATVNHQKPLITNLTLPVAEAFEQFSTQLNATNGTAPYHWRFKQGYDVSEQAASFPSVTQQSLTMSATRDGYTIKTLPFEFPFYGKKYNQIVIYTGGYIEFSNNIYIWPFLVSEDLVFKSHELIAPFKADLVMNSGDGIWFESMPNYVTVRWKMSVYNQGANQVNVSARLYPNGNIEFYYGNINVASTANWRAAVSRGNVKDIIFPSISSSFTTNTTERKVLFEKYNSPDFLSLSEDGLLTGTPSEYYNNTPIQIEVIDNNELINEKILPFSTSFSNRIVLISHAEHAGGDNIVNNGELVNVDLVIRNIDTAAVTNAQIIASSTDPYIAFTDDTEYFGYIGAGNSYTLSSAIKFQVSPDIPNEHPIHINLHTQCDGMPSSTNIVIIAFSSDAEFSSALVLDGNNNLLNSNEIDTILVKITNTGGSTISHLRATLVTYEPNISVISSIDSVVSLPPFSSATFRYIAQLSNSFVDGRINDFLLQLNAEYFTKTLSFSLFSGSNLENFESGDFSQFPWSHSDTAWTLRTDSTYEGNYVARSGMITHNQTTSMSISQEVLIPGDVSFYKKVSCENSANNNWDYLVFSIDGIEIERFDGIMDWSKSSYPVTAGNHTFLWTYLKDYSVSTGMDAAWVDNIEFPMFGSGNPNCLALPDSVHKNLYKNQSETFKTYLINTGAGIATYQLEIKDLDGYNVPWLQPLYNSGSLNSNEIDSIPINIRAINMAPGEYYATINVSFSNGTQFSSFIHLTVLLDIGVAEITNTAAVKVYPNPAKDKVVIEVSGTENNNSVSIYTFTGKLVETIQQSSYINDKQEFIWHPNGLAAGLYFYEFNSTTSNVRGKITLLP